MKKIFFNAIILFSVALVFAGCTSKLFPAKNVQNQEAPVFENEQTSSETPTGQSVEEEKEISYLFIAEEEGQSVLQLLESNAEVISETSEMGTMINGINGIISSDNHYWTFYVNDQMSMNGADSTVLKEGDKVEWRFEKL